jgi:FkbH-like protein
MYETEVNRRIESSEQLPTAAVARFAELKSTVLDRTTLPWSEHCTECVWPTCYSSCDLYSPREDGKCRRFVDGMVRVTCPHALNSYILKISFKRWGKLWTPGSLNMRSVEHAKAIERRDYRIGKLLVQLPNPIRSIATGKRYGLKKRLAYRSPRHHHSATSFLLECYNPDTQPIRLSLSILPIGTGAALPFHRLIEVGPDFNRVRIPYTEIAAVINLDKPFNIELIPNEDANEVTLFFGLMDFVREDSRPSESLAASKGDSPRKVKCVIWDLDNTLWDGVFVEDGPERLTLKRGIRQIIEELDRRGILQSIASKNNHDDVLTLLKRFKLDDYFLVPQINWLAKSTAIERIAQGLNIGLDSLLFVDDSEFERVQVSASLPEVRTIDATRYLELPALPECMVPITAESQNRRKMYRVETQRRDLASSFADDYIAFLRDCDIRMTVRPMTEELLERVHELTQRTNQMNFSGNRYDRDVLKQVHSTSYLDTYVLEVEDRFGTYGVVGFSIVDNRLPIMTDLMFSCRIQSKRVEHAFLAFLLGRYIGQTNREFQAVYRKTSRNAQSGKVFADIGMQERETKDGISRLVFARDQVIPDDGVVTITAHAPYLDA